MGTNWIGLMRRAVGFVWIVLLVLLMGLVGLTQLVKLNGSEVFIVRGGSMAPAIPLGSLVLASPVAPADVVVGDIVTIKGVSGVIYTHRVVDVVEQDGVRGLQL